MRKNNFFNMTCRAPGWSVVWGILLWGVFLLKFSSSSFGQTSYNYAEVLQKSMFFYECQESKIGAGNRVTWRANAAMNDGADVGKDLTGGWFDAGDHVKFNFPMAFSATALAWGAIDFADGYIASGQMQYLKRNLRYVNDYFIKCHTAPNELYGQVGNGGLDHAFWGPPEVMRMSRPAYKIDASKPGSDLAAETAAAMAAASIVFKNDDPTYSATLLNHAKQLYTFAETYKGKYSDAITDAAGYYNSWSGYNDELVWGAIWLYRATNDVTYLNKAETYYDNLGNQGQEPVKAYKWTIAWDDKSYGCYALLAKLTGKDKYKTDAERYLDYWTDGYNGSRITYTPGGLAFLDIWGSLRYAMNTAFVAAYYADVATSAAKTTKYKNFARQQLHYALGSNPKNRSYVCGFGNNPPVNPHHRGAHGAWSNNVTGPPTETRHILYGALVGGPGSDDSYTDDRSNYTNNEVACDYNALFSGLLAKFVIDNGGTPLANFPVPETPKDEYYVEAKSNATGTNFSEWSVWVYNHTAWPAREGSEYKFRLYVNISEGLAAGYTPSSYVVQSNNAGVVNFTQLIAADAASGLYYTEVTFKPGTEIYPGGQQYDKKEAQMRITLPNAPASAWDPTNDPSWQGITSTLKQMPSIPMYVDGVRVFGTEPVPTQSVPVTGVTVSPTTLSLTVGQTATLTATVSPSNATNKSVTWSSSNTSVATVSSTGVVTAVAAGSATITVTTVDGAKTATCAVTVTGSTTVPVTGVTVSPTTLSLTVGQTSTLTATVSPSNATNKSVTWSSSNTSVATVSSSGVVTAVAAGSATITVTTVDGAKTATCAVTVTGSTTVPVTGVTVSPTTLGLTVGQTSTLTATVSPSNATNKSVTWSSSNTSVATVSSTGVVTAVAAGSATITVTTVDGAKTATCAVTVTSGGETTPCANPVSKALPFAQDGSGEYCFVTSGTISYVNSWNMQLVEINGVDYTNKWSNSMPAAINGQYYIRYVANVAWAHLEVNGSGGGSTTVPVTGVTVSPTTLSLTVGQTSTLTATVSPSNATNKSVTWSSSNTSIATVSSTGVVTAVAAGSATITVTTVDGAKTATCAVTVTSGGGTTPCANPVAITIPFSKDGAGEFCYVSSQEPAYVNSWNMDRVEINGVDYTNKWSNVMPAAIGGKWYIYYKGSYAWSHFEAPAAKSVNGTLASTFEISLSPNPFNNYIEITGSLSRIKSIRVLNLQGQVVEKLQPAAVSRIMLGKDLATGIYILQLTSDDNSTYNYKIIKK